MFITISSQTGKDCQLKGYIIIYIYREKVCYSDFLRLGSLHLLGQRYQEMLYTCSYCISTEVCLLNSCPVLGIVKILNIVLLVNKNAQLSPFLQELAGNGKM